jgi:hypothetical protein
LLSDLWTSYWRTYLAGAAVWQCQWQLRPFGQLTSTAN